MATDLNSATSFVNSAVRQLIYTAATGVTAICLGSVITPLVADNIKLFIFKKDTAGNDHPLIANRLVNQSTPCILTELLKLVILPGESLSVTAIDIGTSTTSVGIRPLFLYGYSPPAYFDPLIVSPRQIAQITFSLAESS